MMKYIATRTYIALGLSFVLMTVLLLALMLGLVPDQFRAVRAGRAAMAEAIAANGSALIGRDDLTRLRSTLRLVVDRNEDLLSAAVRRSDGEVVVAVGDHQRHWRDDAQDLSSETFVKVPVWQRGKPWGRIELRFAPLTSGGRLAFLYDPRVHLLLFVVAGAFFLFRFYLGRVLRHLDPTQAVPTHVRSALDTLAEGLIVIDKQEQVVLANAALATILGRTPEQLLGVRASQLGFASAGAVRLAAADSPWMKAIRSGLPQRNDMLELSDAEGRRRTFIVNCSPVLGSGGDHAGVLVSLDDVTELEQNKVELRASKDEAEAANQAKSDFLANMSHEIRTPMNAILGFTDVLRRGYARSSEEREKYLDTIHRSGTHLLQLINDVLDLSKVEAGQLEMEQLRVPAHAVINDVVSVLKVQAEAKGLTLDLLFDSDVPATVATDPTRLRQIATNLIGNAIKFTERGGVQVRLGLTVDDEAPLYHLHVVDSGVGIATDKLDSVFEPFVQADASITRKFGGTGLGLAISRRFARLLGGDIVAYSPPGAGTTFVVTFDPGPLQGVPLLTPAEARAASSAVHIDHGADWKFPPATRVLIVDDGEENRELVRLVLENAGLETVCAGNGLEAVRLATTHRFDMVLMDIQMPVMDGYEASGRLREAGLTLPIVALTADAMKGFEQKCLAAGCSHYLTKPVDIDRLLELLGSLLHGSQSVTASPVATPSVEVRSALPGEFTPIVSTLAQANPAIRATVAKFVDGLPARFAQVQAAAAAGDLAAVAQFAHWLKGAGGTVGFSAFWEPAAALEIGAQRGDTQTVGPAIATLAALAARLERPGSPAPALITIAPAVTPAVTPDAGAVHSRLPLGNPRMRATVERFLSRLDERLRMLEQTATTVEATEFAEFGSWLKGAGSSVGFDHFTAPATQLAGAIDVGDRGSLVDLLKEIRDILSRVELPPDHTVIAESTALRQAGT